MATAVTTSWATSAVTKTFMNGVVAPNRARAVTGTLSGRSHVLPDDRSGFPNIPHTRPLLLDKNGHEEKLMSGGDISVPLGQPDQMSHVLKFGLFIPATNTSMERELWTVVGRNLNALNGIGIHTVNVLTEKPSVATKADVENYGRQFLGGLQKSLKEAKLAQPQFLIMGMSLEHVISDLNAVISPLRQLESDAGVGLAAWQDAAQAALEAYGAKRISLLTPFDAFGDANARSVFTQMGFEVIRSASFNCATAVDIAHVSDTAKERAIVEYLAGDDVDAIVQCGTNMSLVDVTERVEPRINIPIIGINVTLLWYALRECGIDTKLQGSGRLLREF